jgi:hypothetical protein
MTRFVQSIKRTENGERRERRRGREREGKKDTQMRQEKRRVRGMYHQHVLHPPPSVAPSLRTVHQTFCDRPRCVCVCVCVNSNQLRSTHHTALFPRPHTSQCACFPSTPYPLPTIAASGTFDHRPSFQKRYAPQMFLFGTHLPYSTLLAYETNFVVRTSSVVEETARLRSTFKNHHHRQQC